MTSVCIFIGCWPWSIKGHTRRWREIHVSRLLFLFSCPKNPSINHLNFYCIKQRLHFSVCVYCNRSQKTSQRACKEPTVTPLDFVSCRTFLFFTRVTSSVIYYSTHTEKNVIYLLIIYIYIYIYVCVYIIIITLFGQVLCI